METGKEEWIPVGIDDDGTEAYLDAGSIVRDLEATTLFKIWVKHVPPVGSPTYLALLRMVEGSKKNLAPPDHVKQVVEIDLANNLSRDLHLTVCDDKGHILDVMNFRFPNWSNIEEKSIIDRVKGSIQDRFPDTTGNVGEGLKFSAPKVHVKPERIEISNRYRIDAKPPKKAGRLKLEEIDL